MTRFERIKVKSAIQYSLVQLRVIYTLSAGREYVDVAARI
jgi:hypothetical protein